MGRGRGGSGGRVAAVLDRLVAVFHARRDAERLCDACEEEDDDDEEVEGVSDDRLDPGAVCAGSKSAPARGGSTNRPRVERGT